MPRWPVLLALAAAACGSSTNSGGGDASAPHDSSTSDVAAPVDARHDVAIADTAVDTAPPQDAAPDAGLPDAGGGATWRTSLGVCWTDATCRRALIVSHGGDWTAAVPYGSQGAFQRAYDNGADGIKCDFRMTADGIAVAVHSSPFEIWETVDCSGQRVEEMTAADVTSCHMFPSATETFPRVADVLAWARGKLIVMLTVKDDRWDGAITNVIAAGAQDRAFLETNTGAMQLSIPAVAGWEQVRELVNIAQTSDIDLMLTTTSPAQAFMYEMQPTYADATAAQVTGIITNRLHPAGVRSFAATNNNQLQATVQNHLDLFNEGFDVVMSYALANGVAARTQINQSRGITPP